MTDQIGLWTVNPETEQLKRKKMHENFFPHSPIIFKKGVFLHFVFRTEKRLTHII